LLSHSGLLRSVLRLSSTLMKREISLAACCATLLSGSLAARATPFGELYHPRERPAFGSVTLDPTIARWLMTLPPDGDAFAGQSIAGQSVAGDSLAGDPLAGTPIGGEVHELMPPERSVSAAPPVAESAVTAQMLEPAPIGGEVHRLTSSAHAEATASIANPETIKPEPTKPEPIKPEPNAGDTTASLAKPQTGIAVWYRLPGRTASGEVANPHALTAGHRTLPLGSRVRVVNRVNGASVLVRINDRGPRQKKFVIDLSQASAKAIGLTGTAPVTLRVEQWGAIAANSARTPALEGRSAAKRGAHARKRAAKAPAKTRHGG
jgi:rare lipoprotein A